MHSRIPQAVDVEVFIVAREFSFLGLKVLSNLEGVARTMNTFSWEETRAGQLKGVHGGRRTQSASYRKLKELGRGNRANEVGDLPNEASASPASEAVGKELAIRTSQVNAAQRPKADSTKKSKEEATQQGEQERNNQSSSESSEEEGEQVSGEENSEDKEESGEKWRIRLKCFVELKVVQLSSTETPTQASIVDARTLCLSFSHVQLNLMLRDGSSEEAGNKRGDRCLAGDKHLWWMRELEMEKKRLQERDNQRGMKGKKDGPEERESESSEEGSRKEDSEESSGRRRRRNGEGEEEGEGE
ncbi:hypothetical protein Syun_019568 [Stephania yunnanensis]|uniref:Uncharacterized protein n=1 Tax=Stephania yunnanensis TaxID=152371 RepID=A0AAP0IWR2_9MAGN